MQTDCGGPIVFFCIFDKLNTVPRDNQQETQTYLYGEKAVLHAHMKPD